MAQQTPPSSDECWRLLEKLRADCPLVQCITNYVSMDIMANTLLAIGASPAMVHGEWYIIKHYG
jgi:hydroxyethylthiazole kinase